jgi:hypothetical protein
MSDPPPTVPPMTPPPLPDPGWEHIVLPAWVGGWRPVACRSCSGCRACSEYGWLAELEPGAELAEVLAGLAGEAPEELDAWARVEVVAAWERMASWVLAGGAAALLRAAGPRDRVVDSQTALPTDQRMSDTHLCAELSLRLGLAEGAVRHRIDQARDLAAVPAVAAALETGALGARHGAALVEALEPALHCSADPVQAARGLAAALSVVSEVLPRAVARTVTVGGVESVVAPLTPGRLKGLVARELAKARPGESARDHQRAMAGRDVWAVAGRDGMVWLTALLPALSAAAVMSGLGGHAERLIAGDRVVRRDVLRGVRAQLRRRGWSDQGLAGIGADRLCDMVEIDLAVVAPIRTSAQARADALTLLAQGSLAAGIAPVKHGRTARVQVRASLETVLGVSQDPGTVELPGVGEQVLDASLVRELVRSEGVELQRVVTEPMSGAVLDVGRVTRVPTQAMRDHLVVRDVSCRFPGCAAPAVRCQQHHEPPWEEPEGRTATAHLVSLCARHHQQIRHGAGWQLELDPDGTVHWSTPRGRRFTSPPPQPSATSQSSPPPQSRPTDGPDPPGSG